VEQLGDPFAIAGFHSNTRHDVRYLHIKGYGERWGDDAKGRLAAMQAKLFHPHGRRDAPRRALS
jgi:nitric oxide reductase NorD protein